METIRKWTTPTQQLIIPNTDLSDKEVYVTFAQGTTATTFSGTRSATMVSIGLAQLITMCGNHLFMDGMRYKL